MDTAAVPTVALSATLRLLLTMATVCAAVARELSAISKESMVGMMTRNCTCALTLEGRRVPLCNWESAETVHGSSKAVEQIKPPNAREHCMVGVLHEHGMHEDSDWLDWLFSTGSVTHVTLRLRHGDVNPSRVFPVRFIPVGIMG